MSHKTLTFAHGLPEGFKASVQGRPLLRGRACRGCYRCADAQEGALLVLVHLTVEAAQCCTVAMVQVGGGVRGPLNGHWRLEGELTELIT